MKAFRFVVFGLGVVLAVALSGARAQAVSYGVDFNGYYIGAGNRGVLLLPDNNPFGPVGAVQANWNQINYGTTVNQGGGSRTWTITDSSLANPLTLTASMRNAGGDDGSGAATTSDIVALYNTGLRDNDGTITITTTTAPFNKYSLYVYYGNNPQVSVQNPNGNFVLGTNYTKTTGLTGPLSFQIGALNGFSIVADSKPINTIASSSDWATTGNGTTTGTWDIADTSPVGLSDWDVTVSHAITYSQSSQTVSSLTLKGAANMTIPVSASLTGDTDVQAGTLTVNGTLTALTLKVSGGAATMDSGSTGTIGALNVTAGSATLAAGSASTIATLNATAGTTSVGGGAVATLNNSATGTAVTGGTVTNLNVTGGSANLTGGSIATLTASGGSTTLATSIGVLNANSGSIILGGVGGSATTATLKTGSTVDTQGNYLAIANKVTLNNQLQISVTGAPTVDLKGVAGDNIGDATKVSHLRVNGGTVTLYKPGAGPEEVLWGESFETDGQGARYTSNTNLADPAGVASTANTNGLWGRVTSVPTVAFYSNGSSPTEGTVMWMGEDTMAGSSTVVPGGRTSDGLERSAAWLDFNQLSVAGKTGLRLSVDLMASGNASGSGPEPNDEFKIQVKNVDTGVTTDVEYMEGQNNAPYKSKMPGSTTQLNTPGVAKSMSYDLGALGLTGNMQLTFAHSQNGNNGVEYLAFDNIKVYGRSIMSDPIELASTTLEVTATTTVDLGLAPSATLGNLTMQGGSTLGLAAPSVPHVSFNNITATGTSAIAAGVPISLRGGNVTVDSGATLTVNAIVQDGTSATAITKQGAGTLTLTGANIYTGVTTVSGGTLVLGPAAQLNVIGTEIDPGAGGVAGHKADIKAGKLVFDYTNFNPIGGADPAGDNPAERLKMILTDSYMGTNSGATPFVVGNNANIYTTGTAGRALGWQDVRDKDIYGNDLPSGKVTVMYTLYGDATLDGTVNFDDLNKVLTSYNQNGTWGTGDFTYDGLVNFDDLNKVLTAYNTSLGTGDTISGAGLDGQAINMLSGSGITVVPEPSSVVLLLAGLMGLLAYGWRKRK